ncbi:MAG TPA: hypothetical protein VEG66_03215 [Thermoplasmata archaeon]|nr:hypothetical protein [Thermoplasmata archaeon]
MSDNPDGREMLASLPSHFGPAIEDVDVPLAGLPCLRLDTLSTMHEGIWVA